MRSFSAICLIASILLTACTKAETAPSPPERVRILSYNIHHGEGTDGVFDLERLAKVIRSADPDLVALQEVDVKTQRSSGVDQAAQLARLTGMKSVFGQAMPYLGGGYGDAVLSRWDIEDSGSVALPAAENHEPRVATWVRVALGRGDLTFVSTHLDHTKDPTDRIRQAKALCARWPRSEQEDVVLVGDLNAIPGSGPIRTLLQEFTDAAADSPANTFPSVDPVKRIDWVMYRPEFGWRVVECRVLEEEVASDHRPLLVVLERETKD